MSLRFDNSGEYGVRTSNLIDIRSPFTVIARCYIHTFPTFPTPPWQTFLGVDYNDIINDDMEASLEWVDATPDYYRLNLWIAINSNNAPNSLSFFSGEMSSVGWYTVFFARTSSNQALLGADVYSSGTPSVCN